MKIIQLVLGAAGVFSCGLLAIGCSGGGGGGGGGGVGNAAIDATAAPLRTLMLSQSPTMTGAVINGTVNNPYATPFPTGTTNTGSVPLTNAGNEGTATAVTGTMTATNNTTNGSGTVTLQVTEDAMGFVFVSSTYTRNAPSITFRPAPEAYSALALDGTGQAFVIVRISRTVSYSTTFTNTSADTMLTLIDLAGTPDLSASPRPDGTRNGTFTGYEDYLIEYSIAGTPLTAQVESIVYYGGQNIWARSGGPTTSQQAMSFSNFDLGLSLNLNGNADVIIPVGVDLGAATTYTATDNIDFDVTISGGVVGGTRGTDVSGAVATAVVNDTTTSVLFSSSLTATAAQVGNGIVEIDESVDIDSFSFEDTTPAGAFTHALNTPIAVLSGPFTDLEDLLYLQAFTSVARRFTIAR